MCHFKITYYSLCSRVFFVGCILGLIATICCADTLPSLEWGAAVHGIQVSLNFENSNITNKIPSFVVRIKNTSDKTLALAVYSRSIDNEGHSRVERGEDCFQLFTIMQSGDKSPVSSYKVNPSMDEMDIPIKPGQTITKVYKPILGKDALQSLMTDTIMACISFWDHDPLQASSISPINDAPPVRYVAWSNASHFISYPSPSK